MQRIVLDFPRIHGGEEQGLNDAGIETFEGDVGDYIARECGQNTSDASTDGVTELHFNLLEMPLKDITCIGEMPNVFKRCHSYWSSDPKAVRFFTGGIGWLKKDTLPVLKISDYGTTGLTGDDFDRTGKWYGLVRSRGACNKGEGAGGSFGIGKYAPFAASAIRTVYYYTKTDNFESFQGISRLVTHLNAAGLPTQATGYIGEYFSEGDDHQYRSIRDKDSIPENFRRTDMRVGTDIYIPAYRESSDWKERMATSILNNFWPAILLKRILFKIGDDVINHTNIASCMEKYKSCQDSSAYRYFSAYQKGNCYEEKLPAIGNCELRLLITDQRERHQIAVARKNGMIIETWGHFRSRKPITGVFICHDPQGNELLRTLEPPRHDRWDIKRQPYGEDILRIIKTWIKDCISKLLPTETSDSFDLDAITRYLQDHPEESSGGNSFDDGSNNKGFDPKPGPVIQPPPPIVTSPPPKGNTEEPPRESTEDGSGDTGGGEQPERGRSNGGRGGNGGGSVPGPNIGEHGGAVKSTSSVNVLSFRSIYAPEAYTIIIRARKLFEGTISFDAECDDDSTETLVMQSISKDSHDVPLLNNNRHFHAKIEPGTAATYRICFEPNDKLSLRISK